MPKSGRQNKVLPDRSHGQDDHTSAILTAPTGVRAGYTLAGNFPSERQGLDGKVRQCGVLPLQFRRIHDLFAWNIVLPKALEYQRDPLAIYP